MRHSNRWMMVAVLIILSLQLVACGLTPTSPASTGDEPANIGGEEGTRPAMVERLGQTGLNRVILTAEAVKRLGIETAPVSNAQIGGTRREVVPYAAVYYDLNGATWVYTNPAPRTFVRASITVDSITGDVAVLLKGPPAGTAVVTVGASELYGTEFGLGND
jgi:hypothetical protein